MKKNYIYLIIFFLIIVLAYVTNITSIPESLILFENEILDINPIFGIKLEETMPVAAKLVSDTTKESNETITKNKSGNQRQYTLSLLGLNLKTIKADIIEKTKVIPVGDLVGLKLYTKGVLVVGVSEIKGKDNKIYKPYEEAGIKQGDSIIEINGETVETTEELIACVSKCKGSEIKIKYINEGNILNTTLEPVKTSENTYKIGLWVRDAAAGVGTLTFYEPTTNSFAALGHGIQDIDTGELLDISSGEFVTADIIDIEIGKENNPGKIEGTIEDCRKIGNINKNTNFGVYGTNMNTRELNIEEIEEVEVASRNEIKIGEASVICTLENDRRQEYKVEIKKIYVNNNENNKSMIIKITDQELLEKTGGIIQGMSGSPIIQDGKLIGALTHVLVSDPTKGYAIFADKMVSELSNTK